MAIQTTRWSPDTCACVIDYQWDDSVADTARVHTPGTSVQHCSFHAGLALAAHYAVLQDENPRKNLTVGVILAQVATLTDLDITWVYDANRVLNITCPKLSANQKNTLQNLANTKFGVGKVLFI